MARDPLNPVWSGRVVAQARAIVVTWLPQACTKCGQPVTADQPWVVGHIKSRAAYPELTMDLANWWPEHRKCSDGSSHEASREKGRADALRDLGLDDTTPADFPRQTVALEVPALPVSPSRGVDGPAYQPALPINLPFPTGQTFDVRPGLSWSTDVLERHAWLTPFLEIPEDAAPPLYMSEPPADAVGSYGADAIEWIERTQKLTLRWWQRLAITRQLEHRVDGTLCARVMLESAPRRAGKSVRMRGTALWRQAHAALFGETQLIMHTGSDMAICREIQRQAWRWAEDVAGWDVTKGNGKEAIETPEGDRWLVRAQTAVYGYDVTLGLVDEAWDVLPETVSEGLEPATMERQSPQLHLTSTAHRRATSLMRGRISAALAVDDPKVILLVWAAAPGSDAADPDVWRAASPHWSEDRREMIASKYEAALAGQADPQADDPDPLAGFTSQYLNVWKLRERKIERGNTITDETKWAALGALIPDGVPAAAAIESWFSDGVSLALAYTVGVNVVVSVSNHPSLEGCLEAVADAGYKGRPIVGASLADHPALRGVPVRSGEKRTGAAVDAMAQLLRDGVVRHDGGSHLTGQICAVRTLPGVDGPRLVSKGRADAVKAAAWAIALARPAGSAAKRRRILVAKT